VTKSRRDATRIRAVSSSTDVREAGVWSATIPTAAEPDEHIVEFRPERRRSAGTTTAPRSDVAVSTEDDVEVRRVTIVNQSTRIREIDVTSYVRRSCSRHRE
jgi:hypothetical protein